MEKAIGAAFLLTIEIIDKEQEFEFVILEWFEKIKNQQHYFRDDYQMILIKTTVRFEDDFLNGLQEFLLGNEARIVTIEKGK